MYGLEDIACCWRDSSYEEEEYLASGRSCSPTDMQKDHLDVTDGNMSARELALRHEPMKFAVRLIPVSLPSIQFDIRSPSQIFRPSPHFPSPCLQYQFSLLDDWATALCADHAEDVVHGNLTPRSLGIVHGRGTLRNPRQWFGNHHALGEHLKETHGNLTLIPVGESRGRGRTLGNPCHGWLVDKQVLWTQEPQDDDVGGARWAATELFRIDNEDINPTKMSDVYSFACLMLQMLTGEVPYCSTKRSEQVVYLKFLGREPIDAQTPKVLDRHVTFMRWCWSPEPEKRPTMETVVHHIRGEIKKLREQRG